MPSNGRHKRRKKRRGPRGRPGGPIRRQRRSDRHHRFCNRKETPLNRMEAIPPKAGRPGHGRVRPVGGVHFDRDDRRSLSFGPVAQARVLQAAGRREARGDGPLPGTQGMTRRQRGHSRPGSRPRLAKKSIEPKRPRRTSPRPFAFPERVLGAALAPLFRRAPRDSVPAGGDGESGSPRSGGRIEPSRHGTSRVAAGSARGRSPTVAS